jgi:hypothetical protein
MLRNLLVAAALLMPGLANAEFKKAAKVVPQALTIEGMLDKINNVYMSGLQRCYVKALAKDPSLAGKVTVVFTINPWGRVNGSVAGIAPVVDNCLTAQVGTWRFPSPRDSRGVPTEASFKINLLLHR